MTEICLTTHICVAMFVFNSTNFNVSPCSLCHSSWLNGAPVRELQILEDLG